MRQKLPKKHSQWIIQMLMGIASFSLGIITFQSKRSHIYAFGGSYCAESNYPYMVQDNPNLDIFIPQPSSFISNYLPVLFALIVNVINGVLLFTAKIYKEIKLWVKILIIVLSSAFIMVVTFIPSLFLPPIKHYLFSPMTCAYLYGVYHTKKRE